MPHSRRRNVCFVTGTRADFGLMQSTLRAIQAHSALRLQLVVTGMHLDPAHGGTIDQIRDQGWRIDATVPWKPAKDNLTALARATGTATAGLVDAFEKLNIDIVLVVGDRVEAFAAATAAHLSGRVLAHVHGGDRAQGQVDDALRHAITKLTHLHFPATKQSAQRIAKLGEDHWRIHQVGSPGLDDIRKHALSLKDCNALLGGMGKLVCPWSSIARKTHGQASTLAHATQQGGPSQTQGAMPSPAPQRVPFSKSHQAGVGMSSARRLRKQRYALLLLHPTQADEDAEYGRARLLLQMTSSTGFDQIVIVYPNNDPGAAGICRAWQSAIRDSTELAEVNPQSPIFLPDLSRPAFLGLLRDAAVLVGNSSAGIIEAASFGTPVVDIGPRQKGRERGKNVMTVPFTKSAIKRALTQIWNNGKPLRYRPHNIYGAGRTASRITQILARTPLTPALRRKLINY